MGADRSPGKRVIAIDGPSGVGKSTVARRVAEALGLPTLDTGAMYRTLGLQVRRRGIDPGDRAAVETLAEETEIGVRRQGMGLEVLLEGQPVGGEIRHHEVSEITSQIATYPAVRRRMVALQRRAGRQEGAVVEGRDIGTVVFPETPYKFFLHARPEVRAERRWRELEARGESVELETLRRDIERRDARDSGRAASPLRHDASYRLVDTSDHDIDQVVEAILDLVSTIDEEQRAGDVSPGRARSEP